MLAAIIADILDLLNFMVSLASVIVVMSGTGIAVFQTPVSSWTIICLFVHATIEKLLR